MVAALALSAGCGDNDNNGNGNDNGGGNPTPTPARTSTPGATSTTGPTATATPDGTVTNLEVQFTLPSVGSGKRYVLTAEHVKRAAAIVPVAGARKGSGPVSSPPGSFGPEPQRESA